MELQITQNTILALESGKKVEAIKTLRQETGMSLTESKGIIDSYINSNPLLQKLFPSIKSQFKPTSTSFIFKVIIVLAIYYLYSSGKLQLNLW